MNKLKDILYDKNDMLIALIILCLATLVIFFRVNAIMEYPKTLAAGTPPKQLEPRESGMPSVGVDDNASGAAVSDPELVQVYINSGDSVQTIGQNFVNVGLFESVEEFTSLVAEMGVATQIKTGNFIISASSTPEEVIQTILTPGL